MDRSIYVIRVYGQGRTVVKSFSVDIPSHLNWPRACEPSTDAQLSSMMKSLLLKRWDSLVAEQGPIHCAICDKPVRVIKNWPLRSRSKIIDIVFPVCSHGKCEILATQQRAKTVAQISQQEGAGDDVRHRCCVCSDTSQTLKCGRCQLQYYCSTGCQKVAFCSFVASQAYAWSSWLDSQHAGGLATA